MIEEKQSKINKVISIFKKQVNDEKFGCFLDYLNEQGFFKNISEEDIDWNLATQSKRYGPSLPILKCNKTALGIDIKEGKALIGIDPSVCFDSMRRASIYVQFPMKKREYERFIQFFSKLLDTKSSLRKDWMKEAAGCFYGSYAQFGM